MHVEWLFLEMRGQNCLHSSRPKMYTRPSCTSLHLKTIQHPQNRLQTSEQSNCSNKLHSTKHTSKFNMFIRVNVKLVHHPHLNHFQNCNGYIAITKYRYIVTLIHYRTYLYNNNTHKTLRNIKHSSVGTAAFYTIMQNCMTSGHTSIYNT